MLLFNVIEFVILLFILDVPNINWYTGIDINYNIYIGNKIIKIIFY